MEIRQFKCDLIDSNSWLLVNNNCGLLIDAISNKKLLKELEQLDDLIIILTHAHFDHILGLNDIRKYVKNIKVISTKLCSEHIGNIYKNMSSVATTYINMKYGNKDCISIKPFICEKSDIIFNKEFDIDWQGYRIRLQCVKGHSEDGLIAIVNDKYLFSGDTLLNNPTVTRFPTGSTEKFWFEDMPFLRSLNHIKKVYPGHGNANDIDIMLRVNKIPQKYKDNNYSELLKEYDK